MPIIQVQDLMSVSGPALRSRVETIGSTGCTDADEKKLREREARRKGYLEIRCSGGRDAMIDGRGNCTGLQEE